MSHSDLWLSFALGLVLFGAFACGGNGKPDSEDSQLPSQTTSPHSGTQEPEIGAESGDLSVLFEDGQAPPDHLSEDLRKHDPKVDGWPSEVAHDVAKHVIHDFLEGWLHPPEDGAFNFAPFLADDFQGLSPLRPSSLEIRFEDEHHQVYRAPELSQELLGRDQVAAQFDALLQPFQGGQDFKEALKIVRVHMDEADHFRVEGHVQISAEVGGGRRQQVMEWEVGFTVGEDLEHSRIRFIRNHFFEEVHSKRPLFADLTERVFAANSFYEDEFLRGVNEYHGSMDRLFGDFFMGWQGLAVGDLNGDGLDDVYVAQQGGLPNRLLMHKADGSAKDQAARSQVAFLETTRGVVIADFDNDGHQDLALTMGQNILLCFNQGTGVFTDFVGLEDANPANIHSLAVADPDQDGDLDIYACRYNKNNTLGVNPVPYHDAYNGAPNLYWRNQGNRSFENATEKVGFHVKNSRYSLAGLWEDFDQDSDLDLFVANDFGGNNLYRNEGGKFTNVIEEVGAQELAASMGVTCADYDLDGDMDLYISNMFSSAGQRIASQSNRFMEGQHQEAHQAYLRHARGNTLWRNRGDGSFEDVTMTSGVSLGRWAWGAKFVDLNNDGFEDLYVPNGFITNKAPDDL
ncbi:MAG: VCBS repeat-containing protein [Planctomycetota bacterium]|nr:MAG: VCBS repeat-containing protein [Planctomycetota bacterium]